MPPVITTTTVAKDDSSSLSPSLSVDSGFSSIRERPQPTVLCGETIEDELPESRTEINEDVGVELPSVNRLKAMFSHVKEDDSSLRRVGGIASVCSFKALNSYIRMTTLHCKGQVLFVGVRLVTIELKV